LFVSEVNNQLYSFRGVEHGADGYLLRDAADLGNDCLADLVELKNVTKPEFIKGDRGEVGPRGLEGKPGRDAKIKVANVIEGDTPSESSSATTKRPTRSG
jgi:hypothetical protein